MTYDLPEPPFQGCASELGPGSLCCSIAATTPSTPCRRSEGVVGTLMSGERIGAPGAPWEKYLMV